jgi:antitoxin (DNA-binding transcriptional repressor) of toxin-antitoxin stability system
LTRDQSDTYIVHVKRMSASETRQNWFRVLDDVLAGEVVVIERRGRRVVLRAEAPSEAGAEPLVPDYSLHIQGEVDRADEWAWEWSEPEGEVAPSS